MLRKIKLLLLFSILTLNTNHVLAQKFGSLQSTINKIEEIPPIYRLLLLAEEMDKSEKILDMIRSKLSELQEKTFTGEPIPSE